MNLSRLFRSFFKFFLLIIFLPELAWSNTAVIVQSSIIPIYENIAKSIKDNYPDDVKRFILSEYTGKDIIKDISNSNPSVIFTIGIDALKLIEKNFEDIPIISLMIPYKINNKRNIFNIPMVLELEKQLKIIKSVLPKIKNIGIIYSEENSKDVDKLKNATELFKMEIVGTKIYNAKEIPKVLNSYKNKIDLLWIIPDINVVTSETIEFFQLFSVENQKPLITFSQKYVHSGALMSIEISPNSMGKNAVLLAEKIVKKKSIDNGDFHTTPSITFNMKIAKKLGITINKDMLKNAKIIE